MKETHFTIEELHATAATFVYVQCLGGFQSATHSSCLLFQVAIYATRICSFGAVINAKETNKLETSQMR